jgi:ArsR family transcriptional regulator
VRTPLAELILPKTSPLNGDPYDPEDAEVLSGVLKALADPARLRLISLIESAPGHEASVGQLTDEMRLAQPTVSHHLRILVNSGILERDKRGVWAYYRITHSAMQQVSELLAPRKRPGRRPTK